MVLQFHALNYGNIVIFQLKLKTFNKDQNLAYPGGEDRRACPDRKASPRGEFSRFLNFSWHVFT